MDRRSLWLLLPQSVRALPADLVAALAVTVAVNVAVFAPLVRETPLRVPLGLAFVLFVPGYVFVAALFPEAGESPADDGGGTTSDDDAATDGAAAADPADESDGGLLGRSLPEESPLGLAGDRSGVDGVERVALSFGLSVAITPLLGLVLDFTPWGIRLGPIMAVVSGFVLVATAVAAVRRWQLPPDERFRVPYRAWYADGRAAVLEPETRTDAALNVALAAAVVLALAAVTFAILVPPPGERFSAIYLLTETDDGELVADGYPPELEPGEAAELVVGVDNEEGRTVDYTVVVLEQRVSGVGANASGTDDPPPNATTVEVEDQRELDRFEPTIADNESWLHPHEVQPTFTGEDVRLVWLLYPGEVPAEPSRDSTEYDVHLWVDVIEDADEQSTEAGDEAAGAQAAGTQAAGA